MLDAGAVEANLAGGGLFKSSHQRSVVVLPQPEGPSSEKNSPRARFSETPLTAWCEG